MTMMDGYWLGSVLMLLFWVFVIAGIVWLVLIFSRSQARGGDDGSSLTARRILEERLARGEIDVEEFRLRRSALDGPAK